MQYPTVTYCGSSVGRPNHHVTENNTKILNRHNNVYPILSFQTVYIESISMIYICVYQTSELKCFWFTRLILFTHFIEIQSFADYELLLLICHILFVRMRYFIFDLFNL